MKTLLLLLFVSLNANAIEWPNGKISAVSITADDGWTDQLTQADILDEYGMKGTFYLTAKGLGRIVEDHKAEWRSAFLRGHEIGNHSYRHNTNLTKKNPSEVLNDISLMEQWLYINIFDKQNIPHTYAYPGGNYVIGDNSTTTKKQIGACSFAAGLSSVVYGARIIGNGANVPEKINERAFYINGLAIGGNDSKSFLMAKKAIDEGIANHTWTVLVFHQFGDGTGGKLLISESGYRAIIAYIKSLENELHIDTVINVKNYIKTQIPNQYWNCELPKQK